MKRLTIITFLLILGLSGFSQTATTPKNALTLNPFGAIRIYNPFVQIAYQQKLTTNFSVKAAYDQIIKHGLSDLFYLDNDRRSPNVHRGFSWSIELIKQHNKSTLKSDRYFGVGFFYRKVSADITAASDELLPTAGSFDGPRGQYGYRLPSSCFLCFNFLPDPPLDSFAYHKKDYGVNFFLHKRYFSGKKNRLVFDFQLGVGLFYRDAYYEGRDFEKFKAFYDKYYLADGKRLLFYFPTTINIGYRF